MPASELLALQLNPRDHALLDVRERYEYDGEHIPGSLSLPRGILEFAIGRTCPGRNRPAVLYCDQGERSLLAAKTLQLLHYDDVRVLSGGIRAWRDENLPVLRGNSLTAKTYAEKLAARDKVRFVDPGELAKTLEARECFVLDTRTRTEYEVGHIPGAYWAGGDIAEHAFSAAGGRDESLVVYCAGRTRSILAAHVLSQHFGIKRVLALKNGTMAWDMAGFPLESGPQPGILAVKTDARERAAEAAGAICEREGMASISARCLGEMFSRRTPCYLFDVRPNQEYLVRRIPGSISCEGSQMALRADDLIGLPDLPIVFCSDSLVRSTVAALQLKEMGYRDVRLLQGGLDAWGDERLPFERGQAELDVPATGALSADVPRAAVEDVWSSLRQADPISLIDVRSAAEYAPQHIAGSTWIPRGQLESWAAGLVSRKQALVVICDNGQRSRLAAATLIDMGYRDVRFLAGGLTGWKEKRLHVEAGWSSTRATLAMVKPEIPPASRVGSLARTRSEMTAYLKSEEALSGS